jgi:D-alanine-D-alanine ligase-like ATP-grasp enzyme
LPLEEQGLSLRSVPPAGAPVTVMTASNFGGSRDSQVIDNPLPAALEAEVLRAAEALGVRLAGVDVIMSDTSRSLAGGAGAIVDVGPSPALHNLGDESTTTSVLVTILRALLDAPDASGVASGEQGLPAA